MSEGGPIIIISGEGRSGTTMMVELFDKLGFDCGGHIEWLREVKPPYTKFPEVIKHNGGFAVNLIKWISEYHWKPYHLFYMANDMETNIAKRIYTNREIAEKSGWGVEGTIITPKALGLTHSEFDKMSLKKKEDLMKKVYAERLGNAVYGAFSCGVPISVVHYQRFCRDKEYAEEIITPLFKLGRFTPSMFKTVHREHIKPDMVRKWAK